MTTEDRARRSVLVKKMQELEIISRDAKDYDEFIKLKKCVKKLKSRIEALDE